MKAHFFRVPRQHHVYITFLAEGHEGLCTVSTVDQKQGIVRIMAPEGRELELEGLLASLKAEIGMEEVEWPGC